MSDDISRQPSDPSWATILPGGPEAAIPGTPLVTSAPVGFAPPVQGAAPSYPPTQVLPPAGYPPVAGPPVAFPPGGYPAGPGFALPAKKRNTTLIVLLSVLGGVVGIIILAAIAIPVFLNQQKPVPVTLTLPTNLDGATQLTTPQAQQLTASFVKTFGGDEAGLLTGVQAAVYARPDSTGFVVGTGKLLHRPTSNQRDQFMTGFAKGASTQYSMTMAKVPAGPLGGTTECGTLQTADTPAVICISMDNSAVVVAIVYTRDLAQGTLLASQLRSDVEHKK